MLNQEPQVEVEPVSLPDLQKCVFALDSSTLFIRWENEEFPLITVRLKNGDKYKFAPAQPVREGVTVSNLKRDVDLLIEWQKHTVGKVSWEFHEGVPRIAADPWLNAPPFTRPDRLSFDSGKNEELLQQLFLECFQSTEKLDRLPYAITGAFRAVLLQKLGGHLEVTDNLVVHLSKGDLRTHFAKYWIQMDAMYESLRSDQDWQWASKHLIPPQTRRQG